MTSVVLFLAVLAWPPRLVPSCSPAPCPVSDTLTSAVADTVIGPRPADDSLPVARREGPMAVRAPADTVVRRRQHAIEVSDAYELRLRIHRYASYTIVPLFALQSVAGNQLYQADQNGAPRPGWASTTHSFGAAGLGTLFTINTVTGAWNLWDSRRSEVGRTKRWIHSVLLLASDAGFTYSGIKLADDAKHSPSGREQHRRISYISMGAALTGYGIMLVGNH